jgi:hypothetical protein
VCPKDATKTEEFCAEYLCIFAKLSPQLRQIMIQEDLSTIDSDTRFMERVRRAQQMVNLSIKLGIPQSGEIFTSFADPCKDHSSSSLDAAAMRGTRGADSGRRPLKRDTSKIQCFYCHQLGHYKRECLKMKQDKETGGTVYKARKSFKK